MGVEGLKSEKNLLPLIAFCDCKCSWRIYSSSWILADSREFFTGLATQLRFVMWNYILIKKKKKKRHYSSCYNYNCNYYFNNSKQHNLTLEPELKFREIIKTIIYKKEKVIITNYSLGDLLISPRWAPGLGDWKLWRGKH